MNIIDCYRLRNMNLCRFVHSEDDNSTVKTSFLVFIFDFVFVFVLSGFRYFIFTVLTMMSLICFVI